MVLLDLTFTPQYYSLYYGRWFIQNFEMFEKWADWSFEDGGIYMPL